MSQFVIITAGNNSAILLTVFTSPDKPIAFENTKVVFIQALPSDPSIKRIALATPVSHLSSLLRQLDSEKIKVEHVFDF